MLYGNWKIQIQYFLILYLLVFFFILVNSNKMFITDNWYAWTLKRYVIAFLWNPLGSVISVQDKKISLFLPLLSSRANIQCYELEPNSNATHQNNDPFKKIAPVFNVWLAWNNLFFFFSYFLLFPFLLLQYIISIFVFCVYVRNF
jgi:hypothetical protein